ncbi:MAG: hypothetical protein MUE85_22580 [Microscillaceae bacterium]|jgi:hypothetical protein|nr:hypothetical protein [Microscillaceae bacterium]
MELIANKMEYLSLVADILSIIGFIITLATFGIAIWASSEVNKLKMSHLFDKRMPNHLKRLNEISGNISNLVMSYDNAHSKKIQIEIISFIAELKSIIPKLPQQQKRRVKQAIKLVEKDLKSIKNSQTSLDIYWEIYNQFKEISIEIASFIEDKKKSLKS